MPSNNSKYLPKFTVVQLTEFIKYAAANNAVNVAAMLLDYKQQHYPDVDSMEEFTLDW